LLDFQGVVGVLGVPQGFETLIIESNGGAIVHPPFEGIDVDDFLAELMIDEA
jgi:hypothetical protein